MKTRNTMVAMVFIVILVFALCLVLASGNLPVRDAVGRKYDSKLIEFNHGWTVFIGDDEYHPESLPVCMFKMGSYEVRLVKTLPSMITEGTFLAFRNPSYLTEVYIGSEMVFVSDSTINGQRVTPVPGWVFVPLTEEYSDRQITLVMHCPYILNIGAVPETVLGTHAETMLYASGDSYLDYYISVAVIIFGILLFLFSLVNISSSEGITAYALMGAFVTFMGISLICRCGMPRTEAYTGYIEYIIGELAIRVCPVLFAFFLCMRTKGRPLRICLCLFYVSVILMVKGTLLHFTGVMDMTAGEPAVFLLLLAELAVSLLCDVLEDDEMNFRYRNLSVFGILCLSAGILTGCVIGPDAYRSVIHARYILCLVFSVIQSVILTVNIYNEATRNTVLSRELTESKMKVMMSQMQPHFIYNALSTIRVLIKKAPDRAYQMVLDFADYLRFNINAMSDVSIIPFEKELEHIKAYAKIEGERFRDRLEIIYDIREASFSVPPLSVQPFVENAVKHGVYPNPSGGRVRIASFADEENYIITVEDNGVGFDTSILSEGEDKGVGISNATERLKLLLQAEVSIDSEPGNGTAVTIKIPKQRRSVQ